ncbi:class F sortase [Streptomyces sp. NPDC090025]|uniref:class F sortase n=1 Tax=Streptomyces sp. NPDC090025 TaxID=3365922 RepID=UPI003836A461
MSRTTTHPDGRQDRADRPRTERPHPRPRRRGAFVAGALVLAVGGGLLGCAGVSGASGAAGVSETAGNGVPDPAVHNAAVKRVERDPAAPMSASEPNRLVIPSAGVDAGPVLKLGLDAKQEMQVPSVDQAELAGWYTGSVTPGERGASVVVAHYDTARGPALMKDVAKVKPGAVIEVGRDDGTTARFEVREIQQVDKKDFPTNKVYGKTDRPELRLITCGGPVRDGHRSDNIILFADLVK